MRIDIGGGVRLFVDVDGLGLVPDGASMVERPTLLLLHGGPGADHSTFKADRTDAFTDLAQVVYYDHRGHGRSDQVPAEQWNLDTWADDIVRLCDALGVEHPIVFGASFGGMVAQHYIARHPEHPAKVVLACTSARLDIDRIAAGFARRGGDEVGAVARRFWEGDQDALADYLGKCMPLYGTSESGAMSLDVMMRTAARFEILQHFQAGEQRTMDLRAGLAAATCPVLVLGGELDPVCPIESNEEVAASLPQELVRFERIPGAAHLEVAGTASIDAVRAFITS